jgi:two-component system phosphate regulon response regulator PhoB
MNSLVSSRARILLVEDEADIRDLLKLQLARDGHEVLEASDGESAFKLIGELAFDLLVLDWMLPGASGVDLARAIRARASGATESQVPILMLTARAEPSDIITGLESGADDYVTKPFEVSVFRARVRALLRRSRGDVKPAIANPAKLSGNNLQCGEVRLDPDAVKAWSGGQELELTHSEFKLLTALLQNQGRVLTRDQLIAAVQGQGVAVVDRAIDTHVFGLRKKLGAHADIIETVRGVGYRVRAGSES